MDRVSERGGKTLKNSLKKSDTRKDVSVGFHGVFNQTGDRKCKKVRPKSANYGETLEKDFKKRPSSSEPFIGRFSNRFREEPGEVKKLQVRDHCCCCPGGRVCRSPLDFPWGSFNEDCGSYLKYANAPDCDNKSGTKALSRHSFSRRKCRSNTSYTKTTLQKCESEKDLQRVKRSLKLLGFELSDFGISSDRADISGKWKPRQRFSGLATKITNRSISLDSLRQTVRRAWLDDRLDESHRRVLAQAAYEEWYFRKERELWERREGERVTRLKTEENLRVDYERKKEKSEVEFQKWLQRKRTKRKEKEENLLRKQESFSRLKKSEEESEKAFIEWKKTKDKELTKRRLEKSLEEERKRESERQKQEKRIIAEKAYQQWKARLEESERLSEAKRRKQRRKQELQHRKRKEEGSHISFEMWKAAKDEQIKRRMQEIRAVERLAREERLAQVEERMYEAEQAFEDWLERVDLRRQKQFCHVNPYQKNIPWIPG